MGRRYESELSELSQTYAWAKSVTLEPLVSFLRASVGNPLLAVGSGGSYSAAHLVAELHQIHSGRVSKPVTPLDALLSPINLRSLGVIVLSAGGTNADIVSAFREIA